MSAGLQIWDAAGVITLDTSDRFGIVLGAVSGIAQTGSVTVEGFLLGEPFYLTQMNVKWQGQRGYVLPTVTISGTTLRWSNAGIDRQWRILWGIR